MGGCARWESNKATASTPTTFYLSDSWAASCVCLRDQSFSGLPFVCVVSPLPAARVKNAYSMMVDFLHAKPNMMYAKGNSARPLLSLYSRTPFSLTLIRSSKLTTVRDGASYMTLYNRIKAEDPTFLIVENMKGEVFGGFAASAWASGHQVRASAHADMTIAWLRFFFFLR